MIRPRRDFTPLVLCEWTPRFLDLRVQALFTGPMFLGFCLFGGGLGVWFVLWLFFFLLGGVVMVEVEDASLPQ